MTIESSVQKNQYAESILVGVSGQNIFDEIVCCLLFNIRH